MNLCGGIGTMTPVLKSESHDRLETNFEVVFMSCAPSSAVEMSGEVESLLECMECFLLEAPLPPLPTSTSRYRSAADIISGERKGRDPRRPPRKPFGLLKLESCFPAKEVARSLWTCSALHLFLYDM